MTANLTDAGGAALRRAMDAVSSGDRSRAPQHAGWANQQFWMGHAAVTRADLHRFSETFARGGIGQAGVEAKPFRPGSIPGKCAGSTDERRHRSRRSN